MSKKIIEKIELSPIEKVESAMARYKAASQKAIEAEEAAHAAALAAQKAKGEAQKAVDALKMSVANTAKSWDILTETTTKTTVAVKTKRAEV